MIVSTRLEEESDSLIGHFVDQARRAGASWSQIGAAMGVSKQAAQQRFVPRAPAEVDEEKLFSRFTQRTRNALGAAQRIATAHRDGAAPAEPATATAIGGADIVIGLLSEPQGLAARILHELQVEDAEFARAFDREPVTSEHVDADGLATIRYSDEGKAVLRGTMKAVLRLGHNYVGTEHLLLGVHFAGLPESNLLEARGVTVERIEEALAAEFERIKATRTPHQQ